MTKRRRMLAVAISLIIALAAASASSTSPGSSVLPPARAQVTENPPTPRDRLPTMVSSWRLDETSGTAARDSWGTNHGTHAAGVVVGRAGLTAAGLSADYDGAAGRTSINSSASLNVTNAVTLEAWVRPDTLPSSSAWSSTVLRKDGQYLLRALSNGSVVFRLWIGGVAREAATPSGTVAPAKVYHVVATYDGATQAVYVNSALKASRAQAGAIGTTSNPLILGASSSGGLYDYFDGRLDNVALYSSGVSSTWVANRYNEALCRPPYGSFGVGNWPAACWRPYADDSPFNQPLPANPPLHDDSAKIISDMRSVAWGGGGFSEMTAGTGTSECTYADAKDYQHPVYYSKPTDPEFTITRAASGAYDSVLYGTKVRIPDAARPACGGDGHLTVVDQATNLETDFWKVERKDPGGGLIVVRGAGQTRIDGKGLNSPTVPGDANAGRWGLLAGIIRAQELQALEIRHALFLTVKCDNGGIVPPATGHGAPCRDSAGAPNQTGPPMGARIQLDMSEAEINALYVPAWKKAILRALAKYGAIVGDTGGSPWDLQFESGRSYTSFGYEDPVVTYARQAGVMSYNGVYIFDLNTGVDWSRLRVIHPCVSSGDC